MGVIHSEEQRLMGKGGRFGKYSERKRLKRLKLRSRDLLLVRTGSKSTGGFHPAKPTKSKGNREEKHEGV